MTDQTQGTAPATQTSGSTKMPHTWEAALAMWDAGDLVPAFQVENEGATQEQLWGAAFEILRSGTDLSPMELAPDFVFTDRECAVIDSIVKVAQMMSWPQMIARHVHATIPPLMIRNLTPKSKAE